MKIIVAGIGIRGIKQLTLETLEHVQTAKKILYLPATSKELEELLAKYTNSPIQNLMELYHDGSPDVQNYERIFNFVLSEADKFKNILLLVPGHPRVGVTLVQWLEQRQEKHLFELEILNGISSFATMNNDLKRDPLERGSTMLDANRILLFDLKLEPGIDHYIYHVCSIGTSRVHLSDAKSENRIDLLKKHLLQFFVAEHSIQLISSAIKTNTPPEIHISTLGEIESFLPKIHFGTTLFIPASRPERIKHPFLKLLRSTAC